MNYSELEAQLVSTPKHWLVTGVAGFIGSHLAERLLKLNQKVVGLDNFVTGHRANIADFEKNANFQFLEGDVQDAEICKKALEGVDYVLHQAAIGSVPRSVEKPIDSHNANVNGFIVLINEARKAKVKKFVYASSSSVYGDHPQLPKVEDQIGLPLSPYAANKKIDEVYAQTFENTYGLETTGLRYFNVFGPRQDPKGQYAAVIPLWIDTMKAGNTAFINGDGSYSRDFCYIENVVQANLLSAMNKTENPKNVFNIAYGERTTLLELFDYLKEAIEDLEPGLKVPAVEHRDFRKGDIPHSLADISRAKEIIQYDPKIDVRTGLKTTVKFFVKGSL